MAHRAEDDTALRRRRVFLVASAATALSVLVAFREVLTPFALAVVVAYVFAPIVAWLEARRPGLARWVWVVALYASLLVSLGAVVGMGAPILSRQVQRLGRDVPGMLAQLRREWVPRIDGALRGILPEGEAVAASDSDPSAALRVVPDPDGSYRIELPPEGIRVVPNEDGSFAIQPQAERSEGEFSARISEAISNQLERGEHTASTALRTIQSLVGGLVNGVFKFFIMLMLSAYLLITKESILEFFRVLVSPHRRERFDALLARIDRGLSGVVRGQLVICLVNGVLSGVGFYLANLPYWPVLTIIATILSIIPIFGAFLSSVPACAVALQQGLGVTAFVLAWIIGIHQLEANLLNPKIMGDAAKLHPVLVVFALIAGEHFFGILGALLAVPILSIAQNVFLFFREVSLGIPASASHSGDGPLVVPSRTDSESTRR